MREFLDTSVLIAAYIGEHPHHDASLNVFASAAKRNSSCAAHSLAEVYSILTRLPVKPPIVPEQAMLFLADVRERLTLWTLDEAEYGATIQRTADQGITGGRVYDALLLRCAAKAKAETIYTWNLKDFRKLAPELADRIKTP